MNEHVKPEATPQIFEERVTAAIGGLKALKNRLSVANVICDIEVESIDHGIAIQDVINGMMSYSDTSVDGCIWELEEALKGMEQEATS